MAWYLVSIGVSAVFCLWLIPKFQLRSARVFFKEGGITLSDLLKAENDRRTTLAQIFAGLAVLTGLYYSGKTVRLQESGQLTDRINKAVEQLGSKEAAIRLGGIHQLGRIAQDDNEESQPMLHILTNFLEEKSDLQVSLKPSDCSPTTPEALDEGPSHEGQAVIDVIIAGSSKHSDVGDLLSIDKAKLRYIDFHAVKLSRFELSGDDLSGSNFRGVTFGPTSDFRYSQFTYANLSDSTLNGVDLRNTCFAQTTIVSAKLRDAHLDDANLRSIRDFRDSDLTGAHLDRADLRGVDLSQVKGLTASQLSNIKCDAFTQFPAYLGDIDKTLRCQLN